MSKPRKISYDSRTLLIDGKRQLILSGAIHYPRSTPQMWPDLIRRSKEAGLNTIETYVFWNLHEKQQGVFDFSGRLDLMHFAQIVHDHGMNLILRIGPYICAEINFGGFPAWLRDVPGVQMRTWNQPYMREMEKWVRFIADYMRPMFADHGGPIVAAQIENEYDLVAAQYAKQGQKYLQWAIDLGQSLKLNVPWIMCVGGAKGSIETINAFYGHHKINDIRAKWPDQPMLWTENWPGWYDTWGYPHHARSTEDVTYGTARFVAAGGTGVNYYMWHGGTNFGREAMFLQTTTYDYDAPLDEFGLHTTKSQQAAALHVILKAHAHTLLNNPAPKPVKLGEEQFAFTYGKGKNALVFLCNDSLAQTATVSFNKRSYTLTPQSVQILAGGRKVFDTSVVNRKLVVNRGRKLVNVKFEQASTWREPLPSRWPAASSNATVSKKPVEQLQFTKDETDYCWYTTTIDVSKSQAGEGELKIAGAGDWLYIYIDGKLVATRPTPLNENQWSSIDDRFNQSFKFSIKPGKHELAILCTAVGMIKGDWQINDTNMSNERKGIWTDVLWNGRKLKGPWHIQPGLLGERLGLAGDVQPPFASSERAMPKNVGNLTWIRAHFAAPKGNDPLVLDLAGMGKGLAWVNGQCLGRYWLIKATATRNSFPPNPPVTSERVNEPTQRYYHVPRSWLREHNTLVLLEEAGGKPSTIRLCAVK